MWKKGDSEDQGAVKPPERPPMPRSQPAEPRRPEQQRSDRAVIGSSITIRGDISGDEDLFIQGRVEGKIELSEHSVTVGSEGRLKADTHGRIVTIEGEVEGDVNAEEMIVLRPTARVRGNIAAPRVALEDGAKFQGTIDMDFEDKQPKRIEETVSRPAGSATSGGSSAAKSQAGARQEAGSKSSGAAGSDTAKKDAGAG